MIVDPKLLRHRRFKQLKRLLGRESMYYLIGLWSLAQEESPDLLDWSDADIEDALDWEGDTGALCNALRECGWLSSDNVVDRWEKHNAKLIAVRRNGSRGGRPPKNQSETNEEPTDNQSETNEEPTDNLSESDQIQTGSDRMGLDGIKSRQDQTGGARAKPSVEIPTAALPAINSFLLSIGWKDLKQDWVKKHFRTLAEIREYWPEIQEMDIGNPGGFVNRCCGDPDMLDGYIVRAKRDRFRTPVKVVG